MVDSASWPPDQVRRVILVPEMVTAESIRSAEYQELAT
jgi:hypothetical protein